jgi:hypothetical protein
MDSFRETAFWLTVWHAFLATLVAALAIVLQDFEPATALLIAANVTLLFSLALITRAGRLTDRRITRGQFWRSLPPAKRPPGEAGLRMARQALQETWLRFAKGAAALAIVLSGLAYACNGSSATAWAGAKRALGAAQTEPANAIVAAYRSARLLPMN